MGLNFVVSKSADMRPLGPKIFITLRLDFGFK